MTTDQSQPSPLAAWDALGYAVGGPLLCGMVDWLAKGMAQLPVPHQIWFLARDGAILHHIWQLRAPAALQSWQNHYVLISRRALQVAAFRQLDEPTSAFLASRLRDLPPSAVRRSLGLAGDASEASKPPVPRQQLPRFLAQLEPELKEAAARENNALRQYLDPFLQPGQPPVAVVDIGWHGTLQALLQQLLPQQPPLHGFYLACLASPNIPLTSGSSLHGFLAHPESAPDALPAIRELVYLIELFTGTNQPGLERFCLSNDGKPEPVFASQPFSPHQLQAFSSFQKAILRFSRDHPEPVSPNDALAPLLDLGLHPQPSERNALRSLRIAAFGEAITQPFLQVPSPAAALLKPQGLATAFRRSLWRPGFLAALPRPLAALCRMYSPNNYKKVRRARALHPQRISPPFT